MSHRPAQDAYGRCLTEITAAPQLTGKSILRSRAKEYLRSHSKIGLRDERRQHHALCELRGIGADIGHHMVGQDVEQSGILLRSKQLLCCQTSLVEQLVEGLQGGGGSNRVA